MNLIMSDVEETILIVDTDSVPNGQGVINVGFDLSFFFFAIKLIATGCKTEDGNALRKRRWCYLGVF